jgi:regulator of sirC expression with transglutaminase-like and TPR domain
MSLADLAHFAHVASRPEPELDLAQAALLIAEPEYPGLDISRYVDQLDDLGAVARRRLAGSERSAVHCLGHINRLLYEELGFRGNHDDYYDPRNSFLNEVLDRRIGIPITLAVVLLEVCRRAGVEARGVSFPGHFLVRAPDASGPLFVDPFRGQLLSRAQLRTLYRETTGQEREPDPRVLEPALKSQILVRMLGNLRGIYNSRGDGPRLRDVLERIQLLAPSDDVRGELERLGVTPRGVPTTRILN